MKKNINKTKKRISGSALAYALIIMSIVLIILTSMLSYIVSQLKFSANRAEKEKAFQIAEAGIYWYRWYLAHETDGKSAKVVKEFWQTGNPYGVNIPGNPNYPYVSDYVDPEGNVVGQYEIEVNQPDPGSTIVTAKSTGWTYAMPNVKRTVQVRFRRSSWSEFSVLANDFMRFGEGTNVFGKIHSNRNIRFDGLAHNIVSSKEANYDDPDHTGGAEFGVHTHVREPTLTGVSVAPLASEMPPNDPMPDRADVFMVGREVGVPEVSFTGISSNLDFMRTEAQEPNGATINGCSSTGCYFDSSGYGRRITFNGTTMTVRRVTNFDKNTYDFYMRTVYQGSGTITSQESASTYTIPNDGIIFVEDNVWLEGTVNGKRITVVATNSPEPFTETGNIFLGATNLLYTNFNGQDIIGLLAQNNVEILRNSQDFLTIDAALLAKDGRVGRKFYTCKTYEYRTCYRWRINGVTKYWDQVTPEEREIGTCLDWRNWTQLSYHDPTDDYYRCISGNSADYKNTITVNGSLATNLRYGFAWISGSNNYGYNNRILNFDNNLLYYPPPYFPTGTQYLIDLWEEI